MGSRGNGMEQVYLRDATELDIGKVEISEINIGLFNEVIQKLIENKKECFTQYGFSISTKNIENIYVELVPIINIAYSVIKAIGLEAYQNESVKQELKKKIQLHHNTGIDLFEMTKYIEGSNSSDKAGKVIELCMLIAGGIASKEITTAV